MAKSKKAGTAEGDNLEDELIQGSEGLGKPEDSNPGHEAQTEAVMEQGDNLKTFLPAENAINPDQATTEPAGDGKIPLPKIAAQANIQLPERQFNINPDGPAMTEEQLDLASKGKLGWDGEDQSAPMYSNDPDVPAAKLHADRLQRYGVDYVVVSKGKLQQVFTRIAWNQIRGDKGGWKEAVPVPPEVRELRKK